MCLNFCSDSICCFKNVLTYEDNREGKIFYEVRIFFKNRKIAKMFNPFNLAETLSLCKTDKIVHLAVNS
ncbi:MAG: hypothetical protein BGO09_03435 [Bacteroidetes bacterium 47-18]|nr:MAG: hypothetical protein BGO09_03435 [Bacteroidetes bacterium 47-18]